jgi:two-component system, cell cycle sensor histidine kinase and response regulator CckA
MMDQENLLGEMMEENIPEREQRLKAITDSVLDAIILINDKGEISFWNPASERIFGYQSLEVVGKNVHELLAPPEYHAAYRSAFKEFAVSGRGNAVGRITQLVARKKNGEEFQIELSLSGFKMDGRWHAAGIVRDTTDRKRAEVALRESEERFANFLNASKDLVFIKDQHYRYLFVNKANQEFFGLSEQEIIGKTDFELMPEELAEECVKSDQRAIAENDIVTVEERSADRIFEIRKFPVRLACQEVGVGAFIRDITARKRAEEALGDSEEKYRNLVESISDVIFEIDRQGTLTYISPVVRNMAGFEAEDLIGKAFLEFVHPEDRDTLMKRFSELTEGVEYPWEYRVVGKSGEVRYVRTFTRPIMKKNIFEGARGTLIDITDRKKLEEQRLEMERKLLHAQKLESLAVMAGGIAHDFNNQLAIVLGNLELALTDQTLDPETRLSMENAVKASEKSAELSRQMLIYSGSAFYLTTDIHLDELLNRNIGLMKLSFSKNISLNLENYSSLPPIKGDPEQIQRAIMNLLTNASEAIGDNGGDVTIRTGVMDCDPEYLIHSRLQEKPEPGRFVFLEVVDNGCGMSDETLQKIFDPFFTTKFWGRGLGMPEVMGIVKGHHGAIIVDSRVGEGTTIRVLLPAMVLNESSFKTGEVVAVIDPKSGSAAERKTILVVDDEELVRGMVLRRLGILGYDTIQASDGEKGVRIFQARSNEIDLVILDFGMPKMNGVEAFAELIRIKPDVKVILCSGYTEDTVLQSFPGQRPSGVLHKPYKMEDLQAELQRLLEGVS